jgi:hypothetical protein
MIKPKVEMILTLMDPIKSIPANSNKFLKSG